jgi:hypothetical protein
MRRWLFKKPAPAFKKKSAQRHLQVGTAEKLSREGQAVLRHLRYFFK